MCLTKTSLYDESPSSSKSTPERTCRLIFATTLVFSFTHWLRVCSPYNSSPFPSLVFLEFCFCLDPRTFFGSPAHHGWMHVFFVHLVIRFFGIHGLLSRHLDHHQRTRAQH